MKKYQMNLIKFFKHFHKIVEFPKYSCIIAHFLRFILHTSAILKNHNQRFKICK